MDVFIKIVGIFRLILDFRSDERLVLRGAQLYLRVYHRSGYFFIEYFEIVLGLIEFILNYHQQRNEVPNQETQRKSKQRSEVFIKNSRKVVKKAPKRVQRLGIRATILNGVVQNNSELKD